MSYMTSIAKEIQSEIEKDIVVRSALEKKIVSLKGLAVYLIKKGRLNTTVDAVISAIRRYEEEKPLERKYETARKVILVFCPIKRSLTFSEKNTTQSLKHI